MDESNRLEIICQQIENLKFDEIFAILLKIERIVSERIALEEKD